MAPHPIERANSASEGRQGERPEQGAEAALPRPIAIPEVVRPLDPRSFPHPPRDGRIAVPTTIENVRHLLAQYEIVVGYDVVKKRVNIRLPCYAGTPDNAQNVALRQIESLAALNGMALGSLQGFVEAIADRNPVNPVADWIDSKPWDGLDRLPAISATLTVHERFPNDLKEALLRRWLLTGVAAAFVSDFSSRGVLVLQGRQGLGKTRWIESLVPVPLLRAEVVRTGHHLDPRNKDCTLGAVTHWLVELGELDSTLRKDVALLKAFLSNDRDKIRRPYGRAECEYPRRTFFAASVNSPNFLVDDTGNSRFWVLPLVKIDYDHGVDMQQVFAQLRVDLASGAHWRLSDQEQERLELLNRDHRVVSTVREMLESRLDREQRDGVNPPARTATEILQILGIHTPSNLQCKEAVATLRELFGDPKRIHGSNKWRVSLRKWPPDELRRDP